MTRAEAGFRTRKFSESSASADPLLHLDASGEGRPPEDCEGPSAGDSYRAYPVRTDATGRRYCHDRRTNRALAASLRRLPRHIPVSRHGPVPGPQGWASPGNLPRLRKVATQRLCVAQAHARLPADAADQYGANALPLAGVIGAGGAAPFGIRGRLIVGRVARFWSRNDLLGQALLAVDFRGKSGRETATGVERSCPEARVASRGPGCGCPAVVERLFHVARGKAKCSPARRYCEGGG